MISAVAVAVQVWAVALVASFGLYLLVVMAQAAIRLGVAA